MSQSCPVLLMTHVFFFIKMFLKLIYDFYKNASQCSPKSLLSVDEHEVHKYSG